MTNKFMVINKQKNYSLWAKKLMDNNIFSGDGEKTILLWLGVIFDLGNNNNNNNDV